MLDLSATLTINGVQSVHVVSSVYDLCIVFRLTPCAVPNRLTD